MDICYYRAIARRGAAKAALRTSGAALAASLLSLPAYAQTSTPPAARPAQGTEATNDPNVIVVTARKVEERLSDVPVPVSVLNGEDLARNSQLRLQDYASRIPGLTAIPTRRAGIGLIIRGVSSVGGNPTVGVMVDDVPFGSSTAVGGGAVIPDLDPGSLQQIEVLRGPQGTLYGASSMGGLIKFVTVAPSTTEVSGRIEGGVNTLAHSDELGYNLRGSLNLPLGDTVAVRASGFVRREAGYIDDPAQNLQDVNTQDTRGGRVALLWAPSSAVSLRLSGLIQDSHRDGADIVHLRAGLQGFEQQAIPGTGIQDQQMQAYSANLNVDLGGATLTSLTGYNRNFAHILTDSRPNITVDTYRTNKATQEVRLASPGRHTVDWQFGVYYTNERSQFLQDFISVNPLTGVPISTLNSARVLTLYEEYAGFGNLTFNLTHNFDVQVGARESRIVQTYEQINNGIFGASTPERAARSDAFTFLVSPRLHITPNLIAYARVSSGYRAGGTNSASGVPAQYNPDKVYNYEVGFKGDVLDRVLHVDASIYRIDWQSIQFVALTSIGQAYTANGNRARSQGVELTLTARPTHGLTITAWGALNDAILTQPFPAGSTLFGRPGDRLPFAGRFSGNISIDQDIRLGEHTDASIGATVRYVDERRGVFLGNAAAVRATFPAYTTVDLRASIRHNDVWSLNLYVNNLLNEKGIYLGGAGLVPADGFFYIQPRTIGLSVGRSF